jgi:hypothetical protein
VLVAPRTGGGTLQACACPLMANALWLGTGGGDYRFEIELDREYALARAVAKGDPNSVGLKYPDPNERFIKYR